MNTLQFQQKNYILHFVGMRLLFLKCSFNWEIHDANPYQVSILVKDRRTELYWKSSRGKIETLIKANQLVVN